MKQKNPIYVCQHTDFTKTDQEVERWIEVCIKEARRKGALYVRCYAHPYDRTFLIIEGWTHKPPTQLKPRFLLQ